MSAALYLIGRVPHAAHKGDPAARFGRLATVAEAVASTLGGWAEAAAYGVAPRQRDNAARRAILDRLTTQPRDRVLGDLADIARVQWLARAEARAAEQMKTSDAAARGAP